MICFFKFVTIALRKYFFVIFLSLTITATAQPAENLPCQKKLIGYTASWSNPASVDYSVLTHAFYSFLKPLSDGSLAPFSAKQETAIAYFLTQTQKDSCKRLISLSDGGSGTFPIVTANPTARKKFIDNVIHFCLERKFDGVDVDWESMNNESRKKNFTLLMQELRQATTKNKLTLVVTVYFGEKQGQWIENEALLQADWIQVMAYDQTGLKTEGPIGNHASFAHFTQAAQYWTSRGFKKENIVLGLPFYGYKFSTENGGRAKARTYTQICDAYPSLKSSDNQTPDSCFFNGPDLIYQKTTYALENGFAGVMVWEMAQDSKSARSLLKSITKAFKDFCDRKK
ncbi:MAG TPA: glycosyl hydrolase family 18 protein [Cytophagaceae bacterium]|jgi:GH18 family chitinase|nr:glycosyl hydrolase family 18 protein [Cytophagaceae bacterium]